MMASVSTMFQHECMGELDLWYEVISIKLNSKCLRRHRRTDPPRRSRTVKLGIAELKSNTEMMFLLLFHCCCYRALWLVDEVELTCDGIVCSPQVAEAIGSYATTNTAAAGRTAPLLKKVPRLKSPTLSATSCLPKVYDYFPTIALLIHCLKDRQSASGCLWLLFSLLLLPC